MRLASIALAAVISSAVGVWILSGDAAGPRAGGAAGDAPASADASPTPDEPTAPRAPVSVLTLSSTAIPLANELALRGITEASRRVQIKAEVTGPVVSDRRPKGATVAAGEALCRLADSDRPAKLLEAEARLAQAEADANASQRLSQRGFSSETTLAADLAALEAARAEVAQMTLDIDRMAIRAPFDGRLETDTAERGALLMPGEVCATLVALDPIRIVGYAPERQVDALQEGVEASVRLVTGQTFPAIVRFVAKAADVETRTYRVEAEAPNPDGRIRDGMTASMAIPLAEDLAHRLPASALTLDGLGRIGVRIAEPDAEGGHVARFQPVTVLRDTREGVWAAGLPQTAEVIVLGQEYVTDGAAIEPRPAAEMGYGAAASGLSAQAVTPEATQ